jgi:hypothetical protein
MCLLRWLYLILVASRAVAPSYYEDDNWQDASSKAVYIWRQIFHEVFISYLRKINWSN